MSMAQLQLLKNNNNVTTTTTNNDDGNDSIMETFEQEQVGVENVTSSSSLMLLLLTNDAYAKKTTSMQNIADQCFPIKCTKANITTTATTTNLEKFPLPEALIVNPYVAITANYDELLLQLRIKSKIMKYLLNNNNNNTNNNNNNDDMVQELKFPFFYKTQQKPKEFPFENAQLMPIIMVVQEMKKNKQDETTTKREKHKYKQQKQVKKFLLKIFIIDFIQNKQFLLYNNNEKNNNNQEINNMVLSKCAAINAKLLQLNQIPTTTTTAISIKFPILYENNMQKFVFPMQNTEINNMLCKENHCFSINSTKNSERLLKNAIKETMTPLRKSLLQQQQQQQEEQQTKISEYQVQQQLYNNKNADIVHHHNNKANARVEEVEEEQAAQLIEQIDENLPKITVLMEVVALNNAETDTINNKQTLLSEAFGQISAKSEQENNLVQNTTIRENQNSHEIIMPKTTTVNNIVMQKPKDSLNSYELAEILNNRENISQQYEHLNETFPTSAATSTATTTFISSYGKENSDVRDQWSQEVRDKAKRQQYEIIIDACQFLKDNSSVTTTTEGREIDVKSDLPNVIDVQAHVVDAVGVLICNDSNNNKESAQQQQQDLAEFIGNLYKINNINSNNINQLQLLHATTTNINEILAKNCNAMVYFNKNNATENLKTTTRTTAATGIDMKYEMRSALGNSLTKQQQPQPQQQRAQQTKLQDVRLPATISLPSTYRYTLSDTRNAITTTTANNKNNSNDNTPRAYATKKSYIPTYIATPQVNAATTTTTTATAAAARSASLDLESVLPERTRMRRQRRMLSQATATQEIEDPVERLNRLRARISGALSQVKGVLKQYSTDPDADADAAVAAAVEDAEIIKTAIKSEPESADNNVKIAEKDTQVHSANSSFTRTRSKSLDISNDELQVNVEEQNGPIQFRFVRKVRRRASFFDEKEEETLAQIDNKKEEEATKIEKNVKITEIEKLEQPAAMEVIKVSAESEAIENEVKKKNKKRSYVQVKSTKARRASIAAVEGSKIEPTIKTLLTQGIKEQRRPSDTEAIVNKHKKQRENVTQLTETKANCLNGLVVRDIKPKPEHVTPINAVNVASDIEKCNDNNNKQLNEETDKVQNNNNNNNNCIVMVNENENSNKDAMPLTTTTTTTATATTEIVALIDDAAQQQLGVNNNNSNNNHLLIVKKQDARIEDVKQSNETKVHDTQSSAMVAMQLSPLQDSITCTTLADKESAIKTSEVEAAAAAAELKIPIVIESSTKASVELYNCNSIASSAVADTAAVGVLVEQTSDRMPELQAVPAPVHLAEHDDATETDLPFKVPKDDYARKKVLCKKLVRKNSLDKSKTAALKTEPSLIVAEEQLAELPLTTELAADLSKTRKVKKKVIIKRQQRRLSVSDSGFFRETNTSEQAADNNVIANDVETLEKPISYVTEDEQDSDAASKNTDDLSEPVAEPVPLKSCLKAREFQVGDAVMYAERYKKTMVRWKRGFVMERITSISYKLDIDGKEVPAHISYIKKYTDRKVNFGGKEYLEINYEQIEEEEKAARCYSIWNMV